MPPLAFFTFAILREGYGHPRVTGFFDRVAASFAAAERSDGYIDRSELIPGTQTHTWGEPVAPRFFREGEHGGAPRSLSLWRALESVFAFAYAHVHPEALSQRKEWFLPPARCGSSTSTIMGRLRLPSTSSRPSGPMDTPWSWTGPVSKPSSERTQGPHQCDPPARPVRRSGV